MASRKAGILIPLFSFPSTASWGIGEIGDIAPMAAWLRGAGQSILQLLPLNEMAPGQSSPYSALSAMAIDPIFIHVPAVAEYAALAADAPLAARDAAALDEVRLASRVEYANVRRLKQHALSAAFARFYDVEWRRDSERGLAFRAFRGLQAWWIDDYGLFRAVRRQQDNRSWLEWPEPLRRRHPEALDRARRELARDILFYQYLQWLADVQWQAARAAAAKAGVAIFGDLPFMVDGDSADVWARQHQFDLDVTVGVPPDAFSATGQDWGMPSYRWETMAADDFQWLRDRARRSADLYDGYRVDHLVGFFRTFARPRDGSAAFFAPATEEEQVLQGEKILSIFEAPGTAIIAEDLGTVPDYVRASLARLMIPGYRVLRWERHWRVEGQPFRDPADYPEVSVAASGTHDTEPLATWWEQAPEADRQAISELPTVQRLTNGAPLARAPFNAIVRDTLIEALFASGSAVTLNVIQDVFGWRDRINEPSTVNDRNWTFRLPWPCDRMDGALASERQSMLRSWAARHAR
jgi:4-alpha-glucanotransferase